MNEAAVSLNFLYLKYITGMSHLKVPPRLLLFWHVTRYSWLPTFTAKLSKYDHPGPRDMPEEQRPEHARLCD